MDVKEVARQLCDGLVFTPQEMETIQKRLVEIASEDGLSMEELNERCWEDSDAIFQRIWS